jgi:general secretion pathway protein L
MRHLRWIADGFLRWIDGVAVVIVGILGSFGSSRTVQLSEEDGNSFVVTNKRSPRARTDRVQIHEGKVVGGPTSGALSLRGSRVELLLMPNHFLIRPLELPKRAAEFLAGIVRAQVDRLTPWSANEAAVGWSLPQADGGDRIVVTVAATPLKRITPYVEALIAGGARSVEVSTRLPEGSAIKVLDTKGREALNVGRVRRALLVILVTTALGAAAAIAAATFIGARLEAQQDDLARRIARSRSAALAGGEGSVDAATAALRSLERRKHESAAAVIVLEELSRALPDHTHVTELRIEGDKLRLMGFTRDAPALIAIIEQTSHFTRATFYAPTTRAPNETGERFHIEAHIVPNFRRGT